MEPPPGGPEGWREVWTRDLQVEGSGFRALLYRLRRRLLDPLFFPLQSRQNNYNLALLEMLDDLREELRGIRADTRALGDALEQVSLGVQQVSGEVVHLREKLPVAVQRNDALAIALDQKIEKVAARVRDLTLPLLTGGELHAATREDFVYRRLEDGLRGSEAEVREAFGFWVETARGHAPVIDLGCGRGEFLLMCREEGIEARGFDLNERSVADLRERGLEVERAGVPECLAGIETGSAGSILAAHLVEHLPAEALIALFAEAARVLRPGGLLMIETPNAESVAVSASEFWRDPTHLAPRHAAALVLVGRELGFAVERIETAHPFSVSHELAIDQGHPADLQELVRRLNEILFGDQDLRLILRKD
ncbi:MAG TPA: class I SAM-dependent methyltransferase [Thermoanaerobaculia bacterium]|nr:class I SAM-dependent methyltransferase [Thermoanaerobaculia bacterium]